MEGHNNGRDHTVALRTEKGLLMLNEAGCERSCETDEIQPLHASNKADEQDDHTCSHLCTGPDAVALRSEAEEAPVRANGRGAKKRKNGHFICCPARVLSAGR